MADKKDLLIKAGLLTELGTPIPELLIAMDDWADQQNKELKEIVIQLKKDFVLKLEAANYAALSGYSTYLRTNWQPIEDVMWWNEKTNEFASSEELYSYYFIDKQSKQINQ